MKTMMSDPIIIPNPPTERAVMLVIDRSGSMSESAGGGKIKINEARAAAELFVSMVRTNGNRAGLVSFSNDASNPVDFGLANVTNGLEDADEQQARRAFRPAARRASATGLLSARDQLAGAATLPRSILLLTDGMENTAAGDRRRHRASAGSRSPPSASAPRAISMAPSCPTSPRPMAASTSAPATGSSCEVFCAGVRRDLRGRRPRRSADAPAGQCQQGADVPFHVCGEEAITVVIGWDDENAPLHIEVETPTGQILNLAAGGIETDAGTTWRFARIPLPQNGERDGVWKTRVCRPGGGGDSSARLPGELFRQRHRARWAEPAAVQPARGASTPATSCTRGDPAVRRRDRAAWAASVAGSAPAGQERRNVLAKRDWVRATLVNGDVLPARQATLKTIEQSTGAPVTGYVESNYVLTDDAEGSRHVPAGRHLRQAARRRPRRRGHLHVPRKGAGGHELHGHARMPVELSRRRRDRSRRDDGHDRAGGTGPGGDACAIMFTPKDRYGNLVGPGPRRRARREAAAGCTLSAGSSISATAATRRKSVRSRQRSRPRHYRRPAGQAPGGRCPRHERADSFRLHRCACMRDRVR